MSPAIQTHSRPRTLETIPEKFIVFLLESSISFRNKVSCWIDSMVKTDEGTLASDLCLGLNGDEVAYHRFLQKITPKIRTVVTAKTQGTLQNDIDDIVQDVLFSLHLKRHTWQQTSPVLPWVYAITRHRVIDYARSRKRTVQHIAIDDVAEEKLATEDQLDTRHDLTQAIAKLSGKLNKVAHALGLEGKSVTQTSQELGISENAVRIAFHRAIKKIRIK